MRRGGGVMRVVVISTLLLAADGILLIEFTGVTISDGGYDLSVQLRSAAGAPIEAIRCEVQYLPQGDFSVPPGEIERLLATGAFWERSSSGGRWHVDLQP